MPASAAPVVPLTTAVALTSVVAAEVVPRLVADPTDVESLAVETELA
jgi:hypothetical protein